MIESTYLSSKETINANPANVYCIHVSFIFIFEEYSSKNTS